MGTKSFVVLLFIILCWWLIRKYSAIQRPLNSRNSYHLKKQVIESNQSNRPDLEAGTRREKELEQIVTPANKLSSEPSIFSLGQSGTPTPTAHTAASAGKPRINFNEIEIENSHSSVIEKRRSTNPANRTPSRSAPTSEALGLVTGKQRGERARDSRLRYLEKQIHENNRDITMLSARLSRATETNQASRQQYKHALRSEKDRVLFFESRLQAEIEKLNQVEAGLDKQGLTLSQFLRLIDRTKALEQQALKDRSEIARLNEALALAKGYQTGSNKRNKELDTLLRQASRISQLETRLNAQIAATTRQSEPSPGHGSRTSRSVKMREVSGIFV